MSSMVGLGGWATTQELLRVTLHQHTGEGHIQGWPPPGLLQLALLPWPPSGPLTLMGPTSS